ncbi:hypothetical protein Vafri_5913 [Volvox africanus]|nr:hypothetical protein Vafri_5913 [Volvox africanus]
MQLTQPTCVNRQMVASVNALLMPRPRTVHVIAARGCDVFETFSNNVMCYLDDKLVPSLNAKSVSEWFATRVKDRNDLDADRIERRSTWFFQQFMKLAAAAHIPGLSEYFLIFDSDMIALRPLTWFLPLDAASPHNDNETLLDSLAGAQPYPAVRSVPGKSEDGCVNPHPFRMLVNVGGWLPKYGYMRTYELLTGRPIIYGHDNTSLVTHSIVVYKPYMAEFLRDITIERYKDTTHGWALSIVDAMLNPHPDPNHKLQIDRWGPIERMDSNEMMVGFSEFWSYLSWVQDRYPCAFRQAAQRTWTRTPTQFPRTLGIAVKVNSNKYINICCPTVDNIRATRSHGYYFTGYELGHMRFCNYHHEAFRYGYAEWYQAT